jgi:hypothetical protein
MSGWKGLRGQEGRSETALNNRRTSVSVMRIVIAPACTDSEHRGPEQHWPAVDSTLAGWKSTMDVRYVRRQEAGQQLSFRKWTAKTI